MGAVAERARLVTPPGVFAPCSDAAVLLDAALPRLRGDVLDLCSGSGVLALAAVGSRRFDVILTNPPYLPTPPGADARLGSPAWEGGPRGRDLLDRICTDVHAHLRPGGEVLIVQSALADLERTLELLDRSGLTTAIVAEQEGPYGSIVRSRLDYLESAGLLHDRSEPERVAVLSGIRPVTAARRAAAATG